jgi:adenylate cyclase
LAHELSRTVFRFEGFCLHLDRGHLVDPRGAEVGLRPKSFEVLRYFVESAGRLISRDELMEAIWPGVFVTDDSVTQCVAEIRRALGDTGQRLLRTVPKRGYIFTEEASRLSAYPSDARKELLETQSIKLDSEPPSNPTNSYLQSRCNV